MSEYREALITEFKRRTGKYGRLVELALDELLEEYSDSPLYEPMLYALEGGKRIRPILLLLVSEAVGGEVWGALSASVAIELLHTESLIHDDIIDMATVRRGKPAFHVNYGYRTSLLTADFVFGIILKLASQYRDRRVADCISEAALRMCQGEMEELELGKGKGSISWEAYVKIAGDKTASLFEAAAKLGAVLGGADRELVERMAEFGYNLGLAYQMRDDLIDLEESPILKRIDSDRPVLELLKDEIERRVALAKEAIEGLRDCEAKELLAYLTDLMAP